MDLFYRKMCYGLSELLLKGNTNNWKNNKSDVTLNQTISISKEFSEN